MGYYYTKGLPTLFEIRKCIPEIKSEEQLEKIATNSIVNEKDNHKDRCKDYLVMLETMLKYRNMYNLEEYSEYISFLLFTLQELNYRLYFYLENARKKIDYEYRLNSQKKYIHYIISQSELGQDIAGVICGFI
jgi:hypothetical protein